MNPNIRYRYRRREGGQIQTQILSLAEIEAGCVWSAEHWQLLSRDWGTGLKIPEIGELFENDEISFYWEGKDIEGVVKYDEFETSFVVRLPDGKQIPLNQIYPGNICLKGR